MNMLSFEGKEIETDNDGYLKESSQWSEALAEKIAENEGITLSPEHWEVVRFVREFYLEFNTSPAIRMLVKPWRINLAKRKATAVICIACFRKARLNRRQKSPACQSR